MWAKFLQVCFFNRSIDDILLASLPQNIHFKIKDLQLILMNRLAKLEVRKLISKIKKFIKKIDPLTKLRNKNYIRAPPLSPKKESFFCCNHSSEQWYLLTLE